MRNKISYTLVAVFAVDLLATSGDITMTWTSPMFSKLYSNDTSINPLGKPITSDQDAWIASLINVGAMIGPLPFGIIAENFGRKPALLLIAIPHLISYLTFAFARNVYLFYFGRLLGGLAVGGGYTLMPMYIAEIAKDANRGAMSVTLNVFWALGNFLPYAIGPYLPIMWFNIILACIPMIFFMTFTLLAPETPYYLVGANKIEQAEKSLMLLRGLDKDGIRSEIDHIRANFEKHEEGKLTDIFKNAGLRKALFISLLLITFQQMAGINAITFYLQPIFEASGTDLPADVSSTIFGVALLMSSLSTPFLADRLGRKTLLISSCFAMCVGLILMGTFFYIHDSTSLSTASLFWIPIFSLVLYIFSFNFGISTMPWTISSELFPNSVKSISSAAVSSMCWSASFLLTKFFNDMNNTIGRAGSFWLFAGSCFVAGVFSILFVPETKGKSFSEIHDMIQK